MLGSRTATAAVGLLGSLAVTVALWWYFDTLAVFLFLPFVPFLFRNRGSDEESAPAVRECPTCGFRTAAEDHEYCPRDGRRLE
ncbi:hypothetical protein [Halorientalis halophila]|uniref:hypothetical protein n=1 Tax=Halorientalis halophila TaxID=3108499 RepID=UPI003009ADC5